MGSSDPKILFKKVEMITKLRKNGSVGIINPSIINLGTDINSIDLESIKGDEYFLVRFSGTKVKKYRGKYQKMLKINTAANPIYINMDKQISNYSFVGKTYVGHSLLKISYKNDGLEYYEKCSYGSYENKIIKNQDNQYNDHESNEKSESYNHVDEYIEDPFTFDDDDVGRDDLLSTYNEYYNSDEFVVETDELERDYNSVYYSHDLSDYDLSEIVDTSIESDCGFSDSLYYDSSKVEEFLISNKLLNHINPYKKEFYLDSINVIKMIIKEYGVDIVVKEFNSSLSINNIWNEFCFNRNDVSNLISPYNNSVLKSRPKKKQV